MLFLALLHVKLVVLNGADPFHIIFLKKYGQKLRSFNSHFIYFL